MKGRKEGRMDERNKRKEPKEAKKEFKEVNKEGSHGIKIENRKRKKARMKGIKGRKQG